MRLCGDDCDVKVKTANEKVKGQDKPGYLDKIWQQWPYHNQNQLLLNILPIKSSTIKPDPNSDTWCWHFLLVMPDLIFYGWFCVPKFYKQTSLFR